MKRLLITVAILAAGQVVPVRAEIQRCEGPDGKVTYSNEQCPEGTKAVKKVDTRPPVLEGEARAAKSRAEREARELKTIERDRDAEEKARAKAQAAARKKEEQLERECNKKRIAVNKAREAVETSALDKRAALEKRLLTAEADFAKSCPGR